MQTQVLIADSDTQNIELLALHFENSGFLVHTAQSAAQTLHLAQLHPIRAAILDMAMPDLSGHALIKQLRAKSTVPILAMAHTLPDSDRILALNLGADDFVEKPLNPLELVARVRAHLRRYCDGESAPAAAPRLCCGELCLDTDSLSLTKNGVTVPVTLAEYKILHKLMRAPGLTFTKRQLYECINGTTPTGEHGTVCSDENTIMVHISKIRDKIEDDPRTPRYIRTMRGQGYRFEPLVFENDPS